MTKYEVGKEPANVKKRLKTLFDKLDSAYPDKVIVGLHKNHKKWGETVTELYRLLDYPDGKSFLEAYGYKYETASPGGRPKTVDPDEIINVLKERYPDGPKCLTVGELSKDNPDYSAKLKTLANNANSLFGMGLADYLAKQGLIYSSEEKRKLALERKKTELIKKQESVLNKRKNIEEEKDRVLKKQTEYITDPEHRDYYEQFATSLNNKEITITKLLLLEPVLRIPEKINEYPVTEIADEALDIRPDDLSHIEVIIPDTVKKIGIRPFGKLAKYITKVTLPAKLKSISKEMFRDCTLLKEIIIPQGVKRIQSSAFYNCPSLEKVYIPDSVEKISESVFGLDGNHDGDKFLSQQTCFVVAMNSYADSFFCNYYIEDFLSRKKYTRKLNVEYEDLPTDKYGSFRNFDFDCSDFKDTVAIFGKNTILQVSDKSTQYLSVPERFNHGIVTVLDSECGIIQGFDELSIPSTVRTIKCLLKDIGKIVIENNSNLSADQNALYNTDKTVLVRLFSAVDCFEVPDSVRVIGVNAFKDCDKLKTISINSRIDYVGEHAFENCTNLRTINGVENIRNFANTCFDLTTNYLIPETIDSSFILNKAEDMEKTSCIISDGIQVISQNAFFRSKLENIELPSSLRVIMESAFSNCQSLKRIVIPEGVVKIDSKCFQNCKQLEEIIIPDSVEYIGGYAFDSCLKLKELIIPDSIKVIGENAIPLSTNIIIKNGNNDPHFISEDGILYSNDKTILYRFPNNYKEDKFVVPSTVKIIKSHAFSYNTCLRSIQFDGVIDRFEKNCFFECKLLEAVEFCDKQQVIAIPDDTKKESFGSYCIFRNCKNLRIIKLPKSLKSIGQFAFRSCGIEEISIPEGTIEIQDGAFSGNRIKEIELPKSVVRIGRFLFGHSLKHITLFDTVEPDIRQAKVTGHWYREKNISNIGFLNISAPSNPDDESFISNNKHSEFLISVKSASTGEIKYNVLMPPVDDQHYWFFYHLFILGWGANATFDFDYFDENYQDRVVYTRTFYAADRYQHFDGYNVLIKIQYRKIVQREKADFLENCIRLDICVFNDLIDELDLVDSKNIYKLLEYAEKCNCKNFAEYLKEKKKAIEKSNSVDKFDLTGFRKVNKKLFEYSPKIDIDNPKFIIGNLWCKGFNNEIDKLKDYLEANRIQFSLFSINNEVSSIQIKSFGNKKGFFNEFSPLKITGLCEDSDTSKVLVVYSESGYNGITKHKICGGYDRYSDDEEGRWGLSNDVFDDIDTSYVHQKYGGTEHIKYRFPFKAIWNQNNYVVEDRGEFYISEDKNIPSPEQNYVKNNTLFINSEKAVGEYPSLFTDDFVEIMVGWLHGTNVEQYTTIRIGPAVKEISGYTFSDNFYENSHAERFAVEEQNPYYTAIDGWLYNKDASKLIAIPPATIGYIVRIRGVKTVASSVIVGSSIVKSIIIEEGVVEIEEDAFMIDQPIDVYLPSSLSKIETDAFTKNMTIHSAEDSYAHKYAIDNGLRWKSI